MYTFHSAQFRQVIAEKGWSLAALARELNSPVSTVSGWANGRHQPTLGNVERLATLLECAPTDLWQEVTTSTPGVTGAVPLTLDQALVLAVAVALVAGDTESLVLDWRRRLSASEQTLLMQNLILSPQWVWAWRKLQKLSLPSHPLAGYTVQVKLLSPSKGGPRHPHA